MPGTDISTCETEFVEQRYISATGGSSAAVRRNIAGLTSIRGLAALWVVLFHYWYWHPCSSPRLLVIFLSQGYLGVDLFFILSGYVIALNYADELATPTLANGCDFLWKRIARIYPLHFFMLLLYATVPIAAWVFSTHGNLSHAYDPSYFVLSLFLIQNWGFTQVQDWNTPAWSISVEWLAYLLFPALLWLMRRPLQNRWACWLLALASLAALGVAMPHLVNHSRTNEITRLGPIRGLLEFWAGACLFQARRGGGTKLTNGYLAVALAAMAVLFAARVLFGFNSYTVAPTAFLVLVWALSFPDGLLARIMNNRLIMYFGVTSYSIYMVHIFILERIASLIGHRPVAAYVLPLFLGVMIVASYLLYRLVERPARHALRRIDWRRALSSTCAEAAPVSWAGEQRSSEAVSRAQADRPARSGT